MEKFDIIIRPERKIFDPGLKELWHYRDLIGIYTKRSFQLKYKQTILGPLWLFLVPLVSSLIYAFLFGGIAGIPIGGTPALLFYLGSTMLWGFFSNTFLATSGTFSENARLFGKVYFPRLTIPVAATLSAMVNFAIQMTMFLAFLIYFTAIGKVTPDYLLFPLIFPVLLQLGALALGTGIIVSSVTVKYRDLSVLVNFGVQLWMYVTAVVYPVSALPEPWMRHIVLYNPATCGMETFRAIFLGNGMISPFYWSIAVAETLLVLAAGVLLFNRVEKTFMDTV